MKKKDKNKKRRYESKGYSLAKINRPDRISENGNVTLDVLEGIISYVKFRFPNSDRINCIPKVSRST